MVTQPPQNPLDSLLPVMAQAVADWHQANPPAKVAQVIAKALDKHRDNTLMKLLGLERYGDSWEVDHCNNRSGESAAGDYLRKVQQQAIHDWFGNVCLPDLSDAEVTRLRTRMHAEYLTQLERGLRQQAAARAAADASAIIDAITKSCQVENYAHLVNLINPTPDIP